MIKLKIQERPSEDEFVSYLENLFESAGFTIEHATDRVHYDFSMSKGGMKYIVDVKYYRSQSISESRIKYIASQLEAEAKKNNAQSVIIVPSSRMKSSSEKKDDETSIHVWTIENLLFFAKSYELKSGLAQFVDVSLDQIDPESPPILNLSTKEETLEKDQMAIAKEIESKCDDYIKIFQSGQQENYQDYENDCYGALKLLFGDDLHLWETQATSNDNLYRFDTVCRIKENITSAFWRFAEDYFNSKYIVFEYKNYSKPITQKEVYTTARYLYSKAFRNVAFIISVEGNDKENSGKAAKGVLREEGKLIMLLSNNDMIEMLKIKKDHKEPSDYLFDMLDKMMIELEK